MSSAELGNSSLIEHPPLYDLVRAACQWLLGSKLARETFVCNVIDFIMTSITATSAASASSAAAASHTPSHPMPAPLSPSEATCKSFMPLSAPRGCQPLPEANAMTDISDTDSVDAMQHRESGVADR